MLGSDWIRYETVCKFPTDGLQGGNNSVKLRLVDPARIEQLDASFELLFDRAQAVLRLSQLMNECPDSFWQSIDGSLSGHVADLY